MSLAKATAAPFEMELQGRKWAVTPPTFRDFGEFEKWAEEDLLAQAARVMPPADAVASCPRGLDAMAAMLKTFRGNLRFACIVLRPALSGLTEQALVDAGLTRVDLDKLCSAAIEAAMPPADPKAPAEGKQRKPFRV